MPISPSALIGKKFYHVVFFNDYIEDMATFTALLRMYSSEYVCNIKVAEAGFGKIFVKRKAFHVIRYTVV